MFHKNTVKISEILNQGNLLKTCIQTTYPINQLFSYFAVVFTKEQNKIFDF